MDVPAPSPPVGRLRRARPRRHPEQHLGHRAQWLRAAVLGANDGLLSTSSLLVGVASAEANRSVLLAAGVAAVVAGAGSMAVGEFSSVSSQRDAEIADLRIEREELATMPRAELAELTGIYEKRGLPRDLARQVAVALTERDALSAHARDELGLDPDHLARPLQAALVSALSFATGALVPLVVMMTLGGGVRVAGIVLSTLLGLGVLGATGARLGGAPGLRAAVRVLVGGAVAMGVSHVVGLAFNVSVS